MLVDSMVEAAAMEFKQKLLGFCESLDLSELTPKLAGQVSQGLQEAVASSGLAAYRTFLLGFETGQDVVRDAQGEMFRFKQTRKRAFLTVFGRLEVPRRCFQNKSDTKSYVPLDVAWGMQNQYMTPQVCEAVLLSCAHITPEETIQLMEKCTLFRPNATTVKREVARMGSWIAAQGGPLKDAVRADELAPDGTRALVVSADGATVLMNEKGVHFGRPAKRPGGEEGHARPTAYRVAMVGSVSHYGSPETPGETPKRLQSRYVAHMPEPGCPTFKALLEAELDAAESQVPTGTPRVLLLDGSRELWNYFDTNPRYDDYHRCLDFWHAVEHLSVAAEALFGAGEAAKLWYKKYYRLLLESDDGAARICRSIDYYASTLKRNQTSQKHLDEQRTYFRRNGTRMRYATFRANGWPIGSGPIEAACKTLIKTRLCRSGMRWTRTGGQHILELRTCVKSGRWDSTWKKYQELAA
jgi:hypothetical protein